MYYIIGSSATPFNYTICLFLISSTFDHFSLDGSLLDHSYPNILCSAIFSSHDYFKTHIKQNNLGLLNIKSNNLGSLIFVDKNINKKSTN